MRACVSCDVSVCHVCECLVCVAVDGKVVMWMHNLILCVMCVVLRQCDMRVYHVRV